MNELLRLGTRGCASIQIFGRDLTIRGFAFPNVMSNDQRLAAVRQFVNEGISNGSLVPTIVRTFPFDETVEAHRFLESGNHVGKVVVAI